MRLVSSERMAVIDREAQAAFGIPGIVLMENAGRSAWELLKSVAEDPLLFLAGRGNNGGDAFVMARHAFLDGRRNLSVVVAAGQPREGSDSAVNLAACRALGIEVIPWDSPDRPDRLAAAAWVIDGLSGTGLKGPLRSPLEAVARAVAAAQVRVAAVDVPSGLRDDYLSGDPIIPADLTLTMGLPKLCLYLPRARAVCGDIKVARVGFPPGLLSMPDMTGRLLSWNEDGPSPSLPADTYKNRRGHVVVLAGSPGTTGAAWLSSHAAARARAGLVTVYLEPDAYAATAGSYSSVMVRPGDPGSELDGFTAFLAGPGWGMGSARASLLKRVLDTGLPGVIDADGLSLLAGMPHQSLGPGRILTPHPGEMARIVDRPVSDLLDDPLGSLRLVCDRMQCVVVLKSHVTYVMAPDGRFRVWDGMNPYLATGGSGDVLAGVVAGLLAQGQDAFTAACRGVVIHGRAGEIARDNTGSFLAQDLLRVVSRLVAGKESSDGA